MFPSPFHAGGRRGITVLVLLGAASLVHAQGGPARAGQPDPLDPQARVPAAVYTSSLAGYRRLGDDQRVGWKQANDAVNRIGGWRAYAREAQQPDPAPVAPAGRAAPASPAASAPAAVHGGTHRH